MNSFALEEFALFIQQTYWAPAVGQELWWARGVQRWVIEKYFPLGNQKFTISHCKFYLRGNGKGLLEPRRESNSARQKRRKELGHGMWHLSSVLNCEYDEEWKSKIHHFYKMLLEKFDSKLSGLFTLYSCSESFIRHNMYSLQRWNWTLG